MDLLWLLLGLPLLFWIISQFTSRPFMPSLKKKHVFITGGSSGIGLAIAKKALQQGADVTLLSRSMGNLATAMKTLVGEVPCSPDRIRCEAADVSDYEAFSAAIEKSSNWKPIDVLICNAGLTRGGYLIDASWEDLDITVRTTFMGTVNALHAALPALKQRSETHPISIVIMSSLASLFFMYGHSVYSATKYAVRGLAEGLRFELLPYNIKISVICPGFTSTPFLEEALKQQEICDLLSWVNLYSPRFAESPDSVASYTLKAIKTGRFLVTTNPIGLVLATLGRGFAPADSLAKFLMEFILILPFRLASVIAITIFRVVIRRKERSSDIKTRGA